MNRFENLNNDQLKECYEEMISWGGVKNPPADGILEKIQIEYGKDGVVNTYPHMMLHLYTVISKRWYNS